MLNDTCDVQSSVNAYYIANVLGAKTLPPPHALVRTKLSAVLTVPPID